MYLLISANAESMLSGIANPMAFAPCVPRGHLALPRATIGGALTPLRTTTRILASAHSALRPPRRRPTHR